jgi:hypothetical protein
MRERPEVSADQLGAVRSREKAGLTRAALGKAVNAEGCVKGLNEMGWGGPFMKWPHPRLAARQVAKCFSAVRGERVFGAVSPQADAIEK